MKTICAALGMAALLTFSASADTLTLPKGHVLDFGDTVDVLDGRQTYFGKQMKNWAEHEAVEKESKPQAAAIGIIGGVRRIGGSRLVNDLFRQILGIVLLGDLGEVPCTEVIVLHAGKLFGGVSVYIA